jgi:hypothetical protein
VRHQAAAARAIEGAAVDHHGVTDDGDGARRGAGHQIAAQLPAVGAAELERLAAQVDRGGGLGVAIGGAGIGRLRHPPAIPRAAAPPLATAPLVAAGGLH